MNEQKQVPLITVGGKAVAKVKAEEPDVWITVPTGLLEGQAHARA